MMLATLLVATQVLYVSNGPSFGCTSATEVSRLQQLRHDRKSFQTALYERIFQGECVEIARGKVVEGDIDTNTAYLVIDRQIQPPGFIAPRTDFRRLRTRRGEGPIPSSGTIPTG